MWDSSKWHRNLDTSSISHIQENYIHSKNFRSLPGYKFTHSCLPKRFVTLSTYITHHMNAHKWWAYKFFLCELLNLCVVVATLFFTDWFLGGEFLTYGTSVSQPLYKLYYLLL